MDCKADKPVNKMNNVYNSFPLPDMGYKEDILFYLSIDPFIQY